MIDPTKLKANAYNYPPPVDCPDELTGIFPVDFILETIIRAGLEWFRNTPDAPMQVFEQLTAPWLSIKYGEAKVIEISDYIKKFDIKIVQHFSLIPTNAPCFSIQILDGNEEESRSGLDDHLQMVDIKNDMDESIVGREQYGYAAIVDQMHIGIHAIETPDLVKYLYYFLIYILSAFKPQLQERGLQLTTFRATDLSRMNEFLPENMYSRFVNFSTFTVAPFKKSKMPIIEEILGVQLNPDGNIGLCDTFAESDE